MLVDPETPLLFFARAVLERAGVRADAFSCPQKALAAFSRDPGAYRAAILDRSLKDGYGCDQAAAPPQTLGASLLSMSPGLPILFLAGGDCMGCRSANGGGSLCVRKPLTLDAALDFLNAKGPIAADETRPSFFTLSRMFSA